MNAVSSSGCAAATPLQIGPLRILWWSSWATRAPGNPAAQPHHAGVPDLPDLVAALPALLSGGQCQGEGHPAAAGGGRLCCHHKQRLDAAASEQDRRLADADAIAYMQERMKLCPISRNLPDGVRKRIDLTSLG